jgi:hypothetical protein
LQLLEHLLLNVRVGSLHAAAAAAAAAANATVTVSRLLVLAPGALNGTASRRLDCDSDGNPYRRVPEKFSYLFCDRYKPLT